jgi:intracellular multiplication protein IcmV
MGFWRNTRKVSGHFFSYRVDKWISYQYLKSTLMHMIFIVKSLPKAERARTKESFEEAILRLELSPQDLARKAKQLHQWRMLFLGLAVGLLGYALYTFSQDNGMGTLMALALMLYAVSQSFRFHFWHYQLKNKRLGCTLRECLYNSLRKHA